MCSDVLQDCLGCIHTLLTLTIAEHGVEHHLYADDKFIYYIAVWFWGAGNPISDLIPVFFAFSLG